MDPSAENIRRAVLDARYLIGEERRRFLRRRLADPGLVEHAERLLDSHPERIDRAALELMIASLIRSFETSRDDDGDGRR